jgi:hypothetical protein
LPSIPIIGYNNVLGQLEGTLKFEVLDTAEKKASSAEQMQLK